MKANSCASSRPLVPAARVCVRSTIVVIVLISATISAPIPCIHFVRFQRRTFLFLLDTIGLRKFVAFVMLSRIDSIRSAGEACCNGDEERETYKLKVLITGAGELLNDGDERKNGRKRARPIVSTTETRARAHREE